MKDKGQKDKLRMAKENRVKEGDFVLMLRPAKKKGQTRLGLNRFEVIKVEESKLTLKGPTGEIFCRDVSMCKKLSTESNVPRDLPTEPESEIADVPKSQDPAEPEPVQPGLALGRSKRVRKPVNKLTYVVEKKCTEE